MPSKAKPAPSEPSRMRRYLLLELPCWLLVAVSIAYAIAAGGGRFGAFFQASLLVGGLAWLAGGRVPRFALGSLLFGWALGTMALFNFLIGEFGGLGLGVLVLPVTAYLLIVLVLLQVGGTVRSRLAAGGGAVFAVVLELVALGLFRHP